MWFIWSRAQWIPALRWTHAPIWVQLVKKTPSFSATEFVCFFTENISWTEIIFYTTFIHLKVHFNFQSFKHLQQKYWFCVVFSSCRQQMNLIHLIFLGIITNIIGNGPHTPFSWVHRCIDGFIIVWRWCSTFGARWWWRWWRCHCCTEFSQGILWTV